MSTSGAFSDRRRCLRAGLPQRVFHCKCLDLHAGIEDAPSRRIGRRAKVTKHLGTGQMCNETNVRDGWMVTAAEVPGARVSRQHVFDRATAGIEPMREPPHSDMLIKVKLLLKIFSHTRHDEWMRIHSQHLREPAYMCPRA